MSGFLEQFEPLLKQTPVKETPCQSERVDCSETDTLEESPLVKALRSHVKAWPLYPNKEDSVAGETYEL